MTNLNKITLYIIKKITSIICVTINLVRFLLLEIVNWARIIPVLIIQLSIGIIFLYIAFKVLIRKKNRITISFSSSYILMAIAFIVNIIYLPLRINPLVYILHLTTLYLILFGQIFLLLFILNILKIESEFTLKKQIIIIITYGGLLFLLLLLFPGGITINEETNWSPLWSWPFLIAIYIFTLIFITIPTIILSIKLYKKFQDDSLKKKWMYYFIGLCGLVLAFYGGVLYNTWKDPVFNLIWIALSLIIFPSGLLIYYGIGHDYN